MLERFIVVLGQVSTLFLLMSVGFGMTRMKKLSEVTTSQMSTLLLYVVSPAIVLDSFQTECDPALLRSLGLCTVAVTALYILYALVANLFFRREDRVLRAVLRFGCVYGNTGFMGLPLVRAILGERALLYVVVSMVVFNVILWTHGVVLMGGRENFSLKKAIFNPGCLAPMAGLVLFLTHTTLPGPLYNAVHFLGELNTPMAMLVIGAQMARSDLLSTFREKKLYAASAVKLLLIPLLTAVALLPLRQDYLLYVSTVVLAGAPVAGAACIFGERFHCAPERAAQLVTLSTLLSIATLPVVAVLAETLTAL